MDKLDDAIKRTRRMRMLVNEALNNPNILEETSEFREAFECAGVNMKTCEKELLKAKEAETASEYQEHIVLATLNFITGKEKIDSAILGLELIKEN